MGESLELLLAGALSAGYAVAALFFARFWRETRDRLFGFFAAAFVLLAAQRVALGLFSSESDLAPVFYGLRLVAFLIILAAIFDKNRSTSTAP